ncbi:MAG: hypothetical protein Q9218_004379 [Villophora microphyllina]
MSNAAEQETNGVAGTPLSTKSKVLETGASMVQDFAPVKAICAHLNAFHVYADEPHRCVEANHYCSHISEDIRQCLIYDTPSPSARLIGIEYMISASLFHSLPESERKLWHSHVFEVKSGMLIMPKPQALTPSTVSLSTGSLIPNAAWEEAETKEMEDVVSLYGKTYHFWQVDRGDKVPLGEPVLMGSFTSEKQVEEGKVEGRSVREVWGERDERFGASTQQKKEKRKGIEEPEVHTGESVVF